MTFAGFCGVTLTVPPATESLPAVTAIWSLVTVPSPISKSRFTGVVSLPMVRAVWPELELLRVRVPIVPLTLTR